MPSLTYYQVGIHAILEIDFQWKLIKLMELIPTDLDPLPCLRKLQLIPGI